MAKGSILVTQEESNKPLGLTYAGQYVNDLRIYVEFDDYLTYKSNLQAAQNEQHVAVSSYL